MDIAVKAGVDDGTERDTRGSAGGVAFMEVKGCGAGQDRIREKKRMSGKETAGGLYGSVPVRGKRGDATRVSDAATPGQAVRAGALDSN